MTSSPERACKDCGRPIPADRRRGTLYCNRVCKQRHYDATPEARAASRQRKLKRAQIQRAARQNRPCEWCTEPISPALSIQARFCSARCREQNRRNMGDRRVPQTRPANACPHCCQIIRPGSTCWCGHLIWVLGGQPESLDATLRRVTGTPAGCPKCTTRLCVACRDHLAHIDAQRWADARAARSSA